MIRISDGRYLQSIFGIPVAVDIFRATTNIVTMFMKGAEEVIPILNVEEGLKYKKMGYLTFGEKDTEKIKEFDYGNSPTETLELDLKGKKIVILTSNGTKLIKNLGEGTIIASFLNLNAVARYLRNKEVHIFLAHSKDGVQTEDSEFAYALAKRILDPNADINVHIEKSRNGSGAVRLKNKGFEKDIETCLRVDVTEIIPVYKKGIIINSI